MTTMFHRYPPSSKFLKKKFDNLVLMIFLVLLSTIEILGFLYVKMTPPRL